MYRDIGHRPEDHDRAVGAIQIADGLITACTAAVDLLRGPDRPERWGAARSLPDDYPEIWTQLDGARQALASRGVNTIGYDELRRDVAPMLAITNLDGTHRIDEAGLDDARRALAELRLAIPGADWRAIDADSSQLGRTRLGRRGSRASLATLVLACLMAFSTWATAIVPAAHRTSTTAGMRDELAAVVTDRRERIDELHIQIGEVCDRPRVLELMKLLVMDGRFDNAKLYADVYEARCGEDGAVRKWADAKAPKPRT